MSAMTFKFSDINPPDRRRCLTRLAFHIAITALVKGVGHRGHSPASQIDALSISATQVAEVPEAIALVSSSAITAGCAQSSISSNVGFMQP
jgi:hypothetical protein